MRADPMASAMLGNSPESLLGDPRQRASVPTEPAPSPGPMVLHNVTVVRKKTYGCARVAPVPPEEFGISRRTTLTSIQETDYCFHETVKPAHKLIEQGFDADQIDSLPTSEESVEGSEKQARDTVDENSDTDRAALNKATRPIKVTEHYIRLDLKGDGKVKLYRITTAGEHTVVLRREGKRAIDQIDAIPFAAMTPVPITHRFFGRSIADIVADIQRIKSALLRAMLDSVYLANNQRIEIAESHTTATTLADLLSNRPGGIVRTKVPGGLSPIPNTPIADSVYPALEYMDATREWRTGVTRQGQGIDAKALQDQSATAAVQLFTMAQARMRLIARIFAETGIRDMFLLLHGTIRKHDRQQNTARLRGKWVQVDPRQWKTRTDMTVQVGISAGSKAEQMAFLMALLGIQEKALTAGGMGLVTPVNVYNTLKKVIPLGNLKSIEPYFSDPSKTPAQNPPDPKMIEVQGKLKAKEAELEMDAVAAERKAQVEREAMEREFALKGEQMEREFQMRWEQMQAEFQMKAEQQRAELALKARLGAMNVGAKVASAATSPVRMGGQPG